MTLGERAVEYHVPGTNCAQCILLAAKEYTGLSDDQCMRIGMGFGGGLRSGEPHGDRLLDQAWIETLAG